MTIVIYHIFRSHLPQVLTKLLEKSLLQKKKVVIFTKTQKYCKILNNLLWTYSSNSFLPHGMEDDLYQKQHPIWLTYINQNLYNADLLISTEESKIKKSITKFENIIDLSLSTDKTIGSRINYYKKWDCKLIQWVQNRHGLWNKLSV